MTLHLPTSKIYTFEDMTQYELAKTQGLISDNDVYIILEEKTKPTGVISVNGMNGEVVLNADDVKAVPASEIQVGSKEENGYIQNYLKSKALEVTHGQRSDAPEYYFEDFSTFKAGNLEYSQSQKTSTGGSFEGAQEEFKAGNLFGVKLEKTDPFDGEVIVRIGNTTFTESQIQRLLELI